MGKDTCITELLCYTAEINTPLGIHCTSIKKKVIRAHIFASSWRCHLRFLVWLKLLVAVRPVLVKFLPFLSVTANYFSHLCSDVTLDLESSPSLVQIFISIISFILVTSLSGGRGGGGLLSPSPRRRD